MYICNPSSAVKPSEVGGELGSALRVPIPPRYLLFASPFIFPGPVVLALCDVRRDQAGRPADVVCGPGP